MSYVIRIIGDARSAAPLDVNAPLFVSGFDPDAMDGRGVVDTTDDVRNALQFETGVDAWKEWRRVSTVRPLRTDGRPNRPMTAFTVVVEEA